MSTTFASLGIAVESSQAVKAADDLDKLVDAAEGAEKAVDGLGKASDGLANTGKKVAQAEAEAVQGIEKSTGAKQRQADASRRSGASATSEIAIISQLDKAMSGNIGSIEQLTQAEVLLERARKGGLVTAEQQEAYQDRLGKAYDKIDKAEAKEVAQKQRLIDAENRQIEALKRTVNGIDPVTAKLAKLEAQEKAAHEAFRRGAIDVESYNAALAKIGKDRAGTAETAGVFDKLNLGTKAARQNVLQLGNALADGNFKVAAHNILELGTNTGASAASMLALVAPVGLVAAAIGGLAVAYYQGSKEQDAFNKSLILTGNFAGSSANQLSDMARQVSTTVGTTGAAADVLATLAGNGKLAGGSFVEITEAALSMEKATGKSVDATVAEFVKIADDPVAAAKSLNDQYHFLTASVYSQIIALKEQGDEVGAVKLLTDTYADTVKSRAGEITQNLGLIEQGWKSIKSAAAEALDATLDVGRTQSFDTQIANYQKILDDRKSGVLAKLFPDDLGSGSGSTKFIEEQIAALKRRKTEVEANAKAEGDRARIQKDGTDAYDWLKKELDGAASKADKLKKALEQVDIKVAKTRASGVSVSEEDVQKLYKNERDKYKDSKPAAGSVDLTGFNNSKNVLTGILSEYKNAQKELDAAQKAGLISQADYALKREALIGNERDEVTAGYEAEIAALEAVKGKAGTSAAQRIQLDQKIADARTAMVKAQKDADSQLEVLATNETGRLAKQERAITSYAQALSQQQKALELAGRRAVIGVGQGDRQNALSGELNSQQDRFAQQSLELENQRSDPSRDMSDEEFTRKSQALADANKAATDQIRQNYADVEAAQGDWTRGATSAWANYLDSAQNVAGQTKSLFGNAFSSMEDAVVNFAMTGKLSFADFTKSILADMARIAARQASSALLSSLVGAGISYFTGSGTGATGAATAGGAEAGAQSFGSQFDASSASVTFGGGRASGGGVDPNTLYEVNEKGPELFSQGGRSYLMTGAEGGSVTPLTSGGGPGIAAMGDGGASATQINVVVNISSDGGTDASSDSQSAAADDFAKTIAPMIERVYEQKMRKDLGQGGRIRTAIKGG